MRERFPSPKSERGISSEETGPEREEEISEFEVVEETPYGPKIQRIGNLNTEQRLKLRDVLESIGAKLNPFSSGSDKGDEVDLGRRDFMKKTALHATAGVGVVAAGLRMSKDAEQPKELDDLVASSDDGYAPADSSGSSAESAQERVEETETMGEHSAFEKEMMKEQVELTLGRNQIQFVDGEGMPVGKPVVLQKLRVNQVDYSPGAFNELGILEGPINKDWLTLATAMHQAKNSDQKIEGHVSVAGHLMAAYRQKEEPGLSQAVASGEVNSFKEIIGYYATKDVIGVEPEAKRINYVRNDIEFDQTVPPVVQGELRRLVAGLCAQESKFHNGLVSGSEAKGIFQFIPSIWASHCDELKEKDGRQREITSLVDQVEIAGIHFSKAYKELIHWVGSDTLSYFRDFFASEESFQRDLMVPLLINSYNAGSARVGEGVRYARDIFEERNIKLQGKDVFVAIADLAKQGTNGYLAGYDSEAREYVSKVYAKAEVLKDVG